MKGDEHHQIITLTRLQNSLIKAMWCWGENCQMNQWHREAIPEIDYNTN